MRNKSLETAAAVALILTLGLILGMATARWVAENLYPLTTPLFYWLPSAAVGAVGAASLLGLCLLASRLSARKATLTTMAISSLPLSALTVCLLQREVNTLQVSVLLAGSLALVIALHAANIMRPQWLDGACIFAAFSLPLMVYFTTMAPTVGQHDTFEFQVLSYQLGIAHPTGYPLYVMLGKLFTFLPVGNVAYRVNISSALFGSSSVVLLYGVIKLLTRDCCASLLAALSFGFSFAFWSQAVEAEVYALNALFVCAICYLVLLIPLTTGVRGPHLDISLGIRREGLCPSLHPALNSTQTMLVVAAFVYGLSLTHHRTMLLLLPAIVAYLILMRSWQLLSLRGLLATGVAFLTPLVLVHVYIPLRWWQIHGEALAWPQFSDLVLGRQFAAALRWDALFRDSHRIAIAGRTFLDQYPSPALALAGVGILGLLSRRSLRWVRAGWREGVFLLLALGAYLLFGLSYYVPDVSLFLIPSYAVIAIGIGLGASEVRKILGKLLHHTAKGAAPTIQAQLPSAVTVTLVALVPLSLVWSNLPRVDKSDAYEWYEWGRYALRSDLPAGSVILADSEKMAPLHYLQRVEGLRADTETAVFGDEQTNRAELHRHLRQGRTVFLARFLPGLESAYHLRSVGPLVEVGTRPLQELPAELSPINVVLRDGVVLLGCQVDDPLVKSADPVRLTLFWTAADAIGKNYEVRLRLVGFTGQVWIQTKGRAPVNGLYPTGAWRPGEIIPDFHQIDLDGRLPPGTYGLQAALFAPFEAEPTRTDGADSGYVTVAEIEVSPMEGRTPSIKQPLRANFADQIMLAGYSFPSIVSPGAKLPLTLYWQPISDISSDYEVILNLVGPGGATAWRGTSPILFGEHPTSQWLPGEVLADTHPVVVPEASQGPYLLYIGLREQRSGELMPVVDGWLARQAHQVLLSSLTVSQPAPPLPDVDFLPANFENKVLLLSYEIRNVQVQQGGSLQLFLVWQALDTMDEDYTVFVHILDDSDLIWGQEDIQPVYGTYPTTRWREGEIVTDPHTVWTDPQAPLGLYRIQVGLYLLRTMDRLHLVDSSGRPVGDRLIIDLMEIVP